jgi:5-methylcytosine-specific restriction endonuclease McrA
MSAVLDRPVLVLNRSWAAVNVATVARALVLLWNGNARVVDVNDYQAFTWKDWAKVDPRDGDLFIQSTSIRLKVPEVIVLSEYTGLPETAVTFSRRNVFKRDFHTCQYCGKQPQMDELTLDHVRPRCLGGESSWTNVVLACLKCNKKKDDAPTPEAAGMKLRKQPIKPSWRPMYASRTVRPESWNKFISEAYWNVELK